MVASEKRQAAHGEHYIITHTGVDNWSQGQVVPRDAFKLRNADGNETGDRFERLLSLGAIRPATEQEVQMKKGVTAPGFTALSPADQMRIATLEAEIDRLTRVVGDQQSKLSSYEQLGVRTGGAAAPASTPPEIQVLLEEKQAQLESLRQTCDENAAKLDELHQETLKRRDEGAKAAESFPTGSAPAVDPGKAVEQGQQHDRDLGRGEQHPQAKTHSPAEVKPGPTQQQAHKKKD